MYKELKNKKYSTDDTYVVSPADFVDPGVRLDVAFKIDINSFPDGGGVQVATKLQHHQWHICTKIHRI